MIISLPESIVQALQSKAAEEHFGSVEEYVCALLSCAADSAPQRCDSELDRFHDKLRGAGLLGTTAATATSQLNEPFQPISIPGPPLSESIISERR